MSVFIACVLVMTLRVGVGAGAALARTHASVTMIFPSSAVGVLHAASSKKANALTDKMI